jgi:hypothetical protein
MKRMEEFIQRLESFHDDITAIALLTNSLAKQAKQLRNPYTESYPLKSKARDFFQIPEASIKGMMDILVQTWKQEKRLSLNGRTVRLGKEAKLFGQTPESSIDVYDVYTSLSDLQKKPRF